MPARSKDNEGAVADIEGALPALKKRLKELEEGAGVLHRPRTSRRAKLAKDIKNAEFDIKTQEDLLAAKKKEVVQINARYDEDKKRYNELTKGSAK